MVNYLSRYTYRIAISEQRLVAMDDDKVTFQWKDYAANSARKIMALDGAELVRRFLMHVLPNGFMRIRHYGFLVNCHKKTKLALIQNLLQVAPRIEVVEITGQITSVAQAIDRLSHCPKCHDGTMRVIAEMKPRYKRRQN